MVPYNRQISFGFSKQIGDLSALDIDYVGSAGRDRYVRFFINGIVDGKRFLPEFPDTARFWYNGAFSDYHALNVTFRHRFGRKYQLQAAYTLSKVTGSTLFASDDFRLGGSFCGGGNCALDFQTGPRDDPRMVGPLNTDARHRIVMAGTVELPHRFNVSALFRANSSTPYNAFLLEDPDGDGIRYSITDPHVTFAAESRSRNSICVLGRRFTFRRSMSRLSWTYITC